MSWKSFARELERAQRRSVQRQKAYARAVAREDRERDRAWKAHQKREAARQKERAKAVAAGEVAQYETYVEALQALHKQCSSSWDWEALVACPPPTEPARASTNEDHARSILAAYVPGFFEKLFGKGKTRRAELEASVSAGRHRDDELHQASLVQWQDEMASWQRHRDVGQRILQQDQAVYPEALDLTGAFDEVAQYGTAVRSGEARRDAVLLTAEITDDEIVPTEVLKQLASGKLSTKAMPKGQYWELYQDHVCSCAIRLACEIFSALPVNRAIVNIGKSQLSTATGHPELVTFLAVHFTRRQVEAINLEAIDPSDSMSNFSHRMTFRKTQGFQPVDAITFEDQFVTT